MEPWTCVPRWEVTAVPCLCRRLSEEVQKRHYADVEEDKRQTEREDREAGRAGSRDSKHLHTRRSTWHFPAVVMLDSQGQELLSWRSRVIIFSLKKGNQIPSRTS